MTTTTIDVTAVTPVTHHEAMRLQTARTGADRVGSPVARTASWAAATDCPAWDIRAMYQHVLGACEAGASLRENVRQLRRARAYRRRHGGPLEAALSTVQVCERSDLSPAQVATAPAVVARRRCAGAPACRRPSAGTPVSRSTGRSSRRGHSATSSTPSTCATCGCTASTCPSAARTPVDATAEHDGRIVADVVAEWARRHGEPFVLELTGTAGGAYAGRTRPHRRAPVDGRRGVLSHPGRPSPARGLMATIVPF